jgi:AcrR family transcriptional regulator
MPATLPPTSQPSRRLGRPKDVASAETHERLLDVARGLFARDGFDATTNKRIAAAAGITSGAIYHYYSSKAELYAAVYEQVQTIVYGAFEKAVIGHDGLRERFGAVLDVAVETNQFDPSIAAFAVGVAGEAQRHPELRALLAPVRAQHHRFLHQLAADAAERDELQPGVSIDALGDLLAAVLSGLARFSDQTGDARRHADAIAMLRRMIDGTLLR